MSEAVVLMSGVRAYLPSLRAVGTKRVVLSLGLAVLSGVAEAFGLLLILPLLNSRGSSIAQLAPVLVLLVGFLVLSSFARLGVDALVASVTTAVELQGRKRLMTALVRAPWSRVGSLAQGEIVGAVMSEATQVSNGVYALLSGSAAIVVVAVLAVSAGILTPLLLLVTLVFVGLSSIIFRLRVGKIKSNETQLAQRTEEVAEDISSSLGDLKFLRESGTDVAWLRRALTQADALKHHRSAQLLIPSYTRTTVDAIGAVFLALVVVLAFLLAGDLAPGIVFIALFYRMMPRLQTAQVQLSTAQGQSVWVQRLEDRLRFLAGNEGLVIFSEALPSHDEQGPSQTFTSIEARQVEVRYLERTTPILSDVNITIARGERIAIIGESGSGKTTLLDVLLGLIPPTQGSVLINGSEPAEGSWRDLRVQVGIVPQDPPIRRGSIVENITWGLPLDDEVMADAIRIAQLKPLLDSLPAGLATTISSKSVGLSGGQRQRIALARAIYRKPGLLILDEATSALDVATEVNFLEALNEVGGDIALLIVTHRPAALNYVDKVFRIKDGQTHREG